MNGTHNKASSPYNNSTIGAIDDLDALIVVDIQFIDGASLEDDTRHQIANIQFNNLDIIGKPKTCSSVFKNIFMTFLYIFSANQETIVELIGFANRVFPKSRKHSNVVPRLQSESHLDDSCLEINPQDVTTSPVKTEITFDFHRLNILILRAYMRDNYLVARKVGTLTLCEAKINATLSDTVEVTGSLGGLQILDLTPEGVNHQRILSVGKDPLTDPPPVDTHEDLLTSLTNEVYRGGGNKMEILKDKQALSFAITRDINMCIDIKVRMASVWYIHCARFLQELTWCATEFKQYLKTLARSIKEKAADMALGLVQLRPDGTSTPMKTVNTEFINSPRQKRLRTMSMNRTVGELLNNNLKYEIKVDVVLETPVLVVPRSSSSPEVFVAHLGRISISNCDKEKTIAEDVQSESDEMFNTNRKSDFTMHESNEGMFNMDLDANEVESNSQNTKVETLDNLESYAVDIKNMNLYSLDTTNRKGFRLSALPRAEDFYSCQVDAIPILHDTAIQLTITRELETSFDLNSDTVMDSKDVVNIEGTVVNPLRVSLTRQSYEQLLETIDNIFKVPPDLTKPPSDNISKLDNINEEMDEPDLAYKRRLFNQSSISDQKPTLQPKVSFNLPILIIELNNDQNNPLIEIALREFCVNYEQKNTFETSIQVSLRSVQMEDLLRDKESNQRIMVASSTQDESNDRFYSSYASYSCPDLAALMHPREELGYSLPDKLDTTCPFTTTKHHQQQQYKPVCPDTPPPSPQPKSREDNLVIYNSTLVNPDAPNFHTYFHSLRQTSSIDFNSLDLVISVQSWFVLLNFFGLMNDDNYNEQKSPVRTEQEQTIRSTENTKLDVSVRSLNLVLMNDNYEMAKANVSNAHFLIAKHELNKTIEGRLGSIYLNDLTSHGSVYKERFMTSGNEALNFVYKSDNKKNREDLDPDATLKIQMSSVKYVHTKRFVAEIQKFFRDFSQLQMVR